MADHRLRDWTVAGLAAVYALSISGFPLIDIADAVGRSCQDVDQALWCMLGRTPEQALQVMSGRKPSDHRSRSTPEPTPLSQFVLERTP